MDRIGTFKWRLERYEIVVETVARRSAGRLLLGSGTASAPDLALPSEHKLQRVRTRGIDANKYVHSAPLRALYEWGLLGLALFLTVLAGAGLGAWRVMRRTPTFEARMLAAGVGCLVLFSCFQVLLATPGAPGGAGIALVLAGLATLGDEGSPTVTQST